MKMNEIITADEKLRLAQLIFRNTFHQLAPVVQAIQPKLVAKPKRMPIKPKSKEPKKAPMALPPKPLPKVKPIPQTTAQIKHNQNNHQQNFARAVKKTFDKDIGKLPKSLQPLSGNIISPIGGGDPEFNKKLDQARKDYEYQNRDYGSKPRFPE
jgi:hypothetical protein